MRPPFLVALGSPVLHWPEFGTGQQRDVTANSPQREVRCFSDDWSSAKSTERERRSKQGTEAGRGASSFLQWLSQMRAEAYKFCCIVRECVRMQRAVSRHSLHSLPTCRCETLALISALLLCGCPERREHDRHNKTHLCNGVCSTAPVHRCTYIFRTSSQTLRKRC